MVAAKEAVTAAKQAEEAAAASAALTANLTEDDEEAAAAATNVTLHHHPDWSRLPEDLVWTVMLLLDIPDLLHAGAVCASWRAAHYAVRSVRMPINDASPCLLYSRAGDDDETACLYSPNAGTTFKFRLPGGPSSFRRRYVVGSDHGWIVAADEESNLEAFNPLTGAQVDLPPATGLHVVRRTYDDHGRPAYGLLQIADGAFSTYSQRKLRLHLYRHVYLSCRPSAGAECIVLLIHTIFEQMSFARVGDNSWTLIDINKSDIPWSCAYRTATYNKKDGLFYVMFLNCSIYAFDLNGPTPVGRKITWLRMGLGPKGNVVFAPWGDILLAQRNMALRRRDTPVQVPAEYADEVSDPSCEGYTKEIQLYKLDIHNKKHVKITCSDLQGHALFLGFNSPIMVSSADFPRLRPNSVYLADDNWKSILSNMFGCREVGIWNFQTKKVESLDDSVHSTDPWLNWPPPIWITPSLI